MNSNYFANKFITSNLEKSTSLIVERARQLVNQLVEQRGQEKPPFLPEDFAPLLGIKKIMKEELGDVCAVLLRLHDGQVIKVNKKHNLARQNFSCAHEMGHILFDKLELQQCIADIEFRGTFDPQGQAFAYSRAKERLCDIAATELLMTEAIFRKYLLGFGVSVNSIALLSNVFKVSIPTVAIRIEEVSLEPCIALQWKLWQRRGYKSLRLSWSRRKKNCMPVHAQAKLGSSLFKAFETDSVVKCRKKFKIGTEVKYLPMESKGFGYGENRRVYSLAFLDR